MTIGQHFRAVRKQTVAQFLEGALTLPRVGDERRFCESAHCSAEDFPQKRQKCSCKLIRLCRRPPRPTVKLCLILWAVCWPVHGLGEVVRALSLVTIPPSSISWRSEEKCTWVLWVQDSVGLSRELAHLIYLCFWAMPSRTQAYPRCSMNEPMDKRMQLASHKPNSSGHQRRYLQSSKFGIHF